MISPQLGKALKKREVMQVRDKGLDVRLYDTDEILAIGKIKKQKHTRLSKNKVLVEDIPVPTKVTYNLRTGACSIQIKNHGSTLWGGYPFDVEFFGDALELLEKNGVDLNKWPGIETHWDKSDPKRYPELTDFVDKLHEDFVCSKYKRDIPAIFGVPVVLAGHGNIPPRMLLRPRVIGQIIKGTVFPFEKEYLFDFEKGREVLEKEPEYLSGEEGLSYDGNIVLIRPSSLSEDGERYHSVICAHFFNPRNYKKFLDGKLKVKNSLPSKDDWVFKISYGIECEHKWMHFNASKFYEEYKDLLEQGKNDIYLKVSDELIDKIEKAAPLF